VISFAFVDIERLMLVFQLFYNSFETAVGLYRHGLPYRYPGGTAVTAVASDCNVGRPSVPVVG